MAGIKQWIVKISVWLVLVGMSVSAVAGTQPSKGVGKITIPCDLATVATFPDQITRGMRLADRLVNQGGEDWLAFKPNESDDVRHALFDCARSLSSASTAYPIRLHGFMTDEAEKTIRSIQGGYSGAMQVQERIPKRLVFQLDDIDSSLDTALRIAHDFRHALEPVATVVPRGATVKTLAAAVILAGGRPRSVNGKFLIQQIRIDNTHRNGYPNDLLNQVRFSFNSLGVDGDVVAAFLAADSRNGTPASRDLLTSLGLISDEPLTKH